MVVEKNVYITERFFDNHYKSADKVFRKQTLESLTPGILGLSSPTKLEKNQQYQL